MFATLLLVACSVDKQLDDSASNEFKVMMMETADTVKWAIPGDTIYMKVFASISSGNLSRLEIVEQNFETNNPISQFSFTCIDSSKTLTIDENGYLSRPVSTMMAYYPVVIPEEPESLGQILSMAFKVTAEDGRSETIQTNYEVSNFAIEEEEADLLNCRFYSSENHEAYDKSNYLEHKADIDWISYRNDENIWYILSPSSKKAAEVLTDSIINYPREEMLTTKFIVLDKEYDEITESDLDALDFTEGEEILQIENGMVIGYVNSRGRRCIINITTSANSISLESVHDFYITHPIEQTLKYCVLITNTQHPNY